VATHLADDETRCIPRKRNSPAGVESIRRLEQADDADLDEVVEALGVAESAGDRTHEREVALHEDVADAAVAGRPELAE
jgi:hypothetical protein